MPISAGRKGLGFAAHVYTFLMRLIAFTGLVLGALPMCHTYFRPCQYALYQGKRCSL